MERNMLMTVMVFGEENFEEVEVTTKAWHAKPKRSMRKWQRIPTSSMPDRHILHN